ncbi:MAG: hypothetical protein M3Q75_01170 [Gemmatimonadota bacterium]|nr:hypothetical protein [Gemmatimonadota bacterium]
MGLGPRDIPHGFRVEGTAPARLLLFATPAGFEQFVVELGEPAADWSSPPSAPPDMATLMAVAAKYRVDILGPLPDEDVPVGQATRGSSGDRERSEAMSGEENAAVVERWIETYNARDTRAEAAARAPGFVAHVPGVPGPLDGDAWAGFTASLIVSIVHLPCYCGTRAPADVHQHRGIASSGARNEHPWTTTVIRFVPVATGSPPATTVHLVAAVILRNRGYAARARTAPSRIAGDTTMDATVDVSDTSPLGATS